MPSTSYVIGPKKRCVKSEYKILNPKAVDNASDIKQAASAILESTGLDPDQFRLGHTKVFFRAGVLGQMEELRDDRLGKIVGWMQSYMRGYLSRKEYKKIQEQRLALQVVQRNLRKYLKLRTWPWWKLWTKVKPLLNVRDIEAELEKLEEKVAQTEASLAREEKARKEVEALNAKLLEEKTTLLKNLEGEKSGLSSIQERAAKLAAQKADLETQLASLPGRSSYQKFADSSPSRFRVETSEELCSNDQRSVERQDWKTIASVKRQFRTLTNLASLQ
ncbi:hypothetical protein M8J77_013076 [Diaphorina citri]|nr:hypothetical protein M8J77_013076 [Diaphorina citri]